MREIKYQAFVVVQKLDNLGPNMHLAGVSEYEVMIDVHNISFDKGKVDYITDLEGDEYTFADKNLIAIREYTGLKDKNGKEIYEGDIVEYNDFNSLRTGGHAEDKIIVGKVAFSCGMWMVEENNCGHDLYEGLVNDEELEIIGNIYENPELLEATA